MRRVLLAVALVLVASPAFAQSAITYELKIYAAGASSPQQTYTLSGVQCGQPKVVGSNVNPTTVAWDDPANAGLDCKMVEAAGGPILSRPLGSYEGTLTARNEAGVSAESARAPFFVKAAPAVPTGLRFFR